MIGFYLLVCKVMSKTYLEKASPFASWSLINCKEFDDVVWG